MRRRRVAGMTLAMSVLAAWPGRAQDDGPSLHELAASGRFDRIPSALRQGAAVDDTDAAGQTALHVAALEGQLFAVMALVGRGANVNARDRRGRTPLHAVAGGSEETMTARALIARLLLAEGADPKRRDEDGKRPVDYATAAEMIDALRP